MDLSQKNLEFQGLCVSKANYEDAKLKNSEGSCLSKTGRHLYSRSKLAPSSEPLTASWRKYQQMHKLCSSGRNWTSSTLRGDGDGDDHCKFLFYMEGSEGLGNRILSLASAGTYALLTNRVLMVDSRGTLSRILCEPFEGSTWLLPEDFPYGVLDVAPSLGAAIEGNFSVNVIRLCLNHDQTASDSMFLCEESQEGLDTVKNLAWLSNQYHLTSLYQVPLLWKQLLQLFPEEDFQVFARISELLISPSNNVWKVVTKFYDDELLSSSRTLIGVQIRPFYRPNITAFDPFVTKLIEECLEDALVVPKTSGNSTSGGHDPADVSIFVASLQSKYFEFFQDLYEHHATEDGKVVRVHSMSNEGYEQHSLEQDVLAMAEMWLLGLSDHIVTSEFSTFGYVANGISGLRPFFLGLQRSRSCYRSPTSQPCTHFPQAPKCKARLSTEHEAWLSLHVKACFDHRNGVQLFRS